MTVKQVSDLRPFSIRDACNGFILSLRASNRYAPGLEASLAFLSRYAEAQECSPVAHLTTSHLEEYLAYLHDRPRWFGARDPGGKPS